MTVYVVVLKDLGGRFKDLKIFSSLYSAKDYVTKCGYENTEIVEQEVEGAE